MAANISSSSSSFAYADFTPVKPRKSRKNRPQRTAPPISPATIDALRAQLRADSWFAQCSHVIEREWTAKFSKSAKARVLCLGLGSPSASPISRIQLAFLAELCKLLDIIPDAISLYDPVFSADDNALFSEMNMHVLPWENSAPEYALDNDTPTLWFMPHCDMELYETLLAANFSSTSLVNCFLLGNQLQEYIDNKPTSVLQAKAPCLLRAAPLFQTYALPPSSAWPTAFNNTAVQVIKVKPDAKGSASGIVVTPSSPGSSTRLPSRPNQSAPGALRQPEEEVDRSDNSGASEGHSAGSGPDQLQAAHNSATVQANEHTIAEDKSSAAGPAEPDSEETDGGMVLMDAYMAIFDDALPPSSPGSPPHSKSRTPASASKPAPGPAPASQPPQAPQI